MSEETSAFSSKVPQCVKEACYEYEGIVTPCFMPPRCLEGQRNFKVRPDDIFVVTWPKSGTTWVEQMTHLIQENGDLTKLQQNHIFLMVPFLGVVVDVANPSVSPTFIEMADGMDSPRILKSHSVPKFLPKDIRTGDPKVKVIYIARNPKDAAVSYYHFCHYLKELPSYESWDVFFEEFLVGRAPEGSWFENVLPWWKKRHHPNVLFLKYEEIKKDPHETIRQIAKFMGKSLSTTVVEKIATVSSFDAMKKSPSSNPDSIVLGEIRETGKSFMRKGIVGDWRNYFSKEQNRRFDEVYRRELAGTGLEMDFGPTDLTSNL